MSLPLTRRIARAALLVAAGAVPAVGAAGTASAVELPATGNLGGLTQLDNAAGTVDGAAQSVTEVAGEAGGNAVKKSAPTAGKTGGKAVSSTAPLAQQAGGGAAEVIGETAQSATDGGLPTESLMGGLPVGGGGLPTDQLPVGSLPVG